VRPIPKSGPGRLIWGKINGEETGAYGKRKYEQFFVGTEQQFRDRAGASLSFRIQIRIVKYFAQLLSVLL
jgi:hypothetical protein